ncbi:MAG: hypothetical protein ACKV0T_03730 [Planctomycetales bacterium]
MTNPGELNAIPHHVYGSSRTGLGEIVGSRVHEDTLHAPGYSLWRYSASAQRWTMSADNSRKGYATAGAPQRAGKYDGEILRLVSVPGSAL